MGSKPHAHVSVLADAVIGWLEVKPTGVYVDCTAGAGGHSALIASRLTEGRLVALDRDPVALALAKERLSTYPNATVVHKNYSQLREALHELSIDQVDGILIDAGLSSMQIDDAGRGFTFQAEGPLDMRMDTTTGPTAAEFIRDASEAELAAFLREYGDIGPAKRIASAIVRRSQAGHMDTTADLRAAVVDALAFVQGIPDEVRTVFQALRMAVNDELASLKQALERAIDVLAPNGRLVVISFHSGEDRVVKNVLRDAARPKRDLFPDGRVRATHPPRLKILTPKPVQPDETEIRQNPRAHSARLRAAQRLGE